MSKSSYKSRYTLLRKLTDNALDKTQEYTKYRGVHNEDDDIAGHTRYIISIRNAWYDLRRKLIDEYGPDDFAIESVQDPCCTNPDTVDIMWQHWRVTKPCIAVVIIGLKKNNLWNDRVRHS